MAQFLRPDQDVVAWASGTFADIDETSASDSDKVVSDSAPSSDVAVYRLSDAEDPLVSTGHIVRYRYQKSAASGAGIDLTVQLRQSYTNEGTPGTLIKQWSHTGISNGWTTAEQTLSAGEANSITDYTALYIRFVANQT